MRERGKATPAITVFFSDFLERDVRKDKCPPHLRDGAICRTRALSLGNQLLH